MQEWIAEHIGLIMTILGIIGSILSVVFGNKYAKYKRFAVQVAKSFADGELTADETRACIRILTEEATSQKVKEENRDDTMKAG